MHASPTVFASRIQRFRLPRVCVAVVGEDASKIIDRAESLVRDNPFLEFRLDYLANPAAGLPKLKHFLDLHPEATVIATCRRAVNGGKFKGSAAAQLDILTKAAATGLPVSRYRVAKRRDPEGRPNWRNLRIGSESSCRSTTSRPPRSWKIRSPR